MNERTPEDHSQIEEALLVEKKEIKERDRFVIPCTIFGVLSGILFWKWGKGIHLAPGVIPWMYLLFKCYRFEGNENLLTQALREQNLLKLMMTLGLPVTTPIILHLLSK